jgi:gliding motility-associated-like protein
MVADFTAPTAICPGDTVDFVDGSTSTYPLTEWRWAFEDGSEADTRQHPRHVFQYGGLYNVGLATANTKGCTDTVFKKILVDPVHANAGPDTILVRGESLSFQANGGTNYLWTPPDYLNDPLIANPTGHFIQNGKFSYILKVTSAIGCISYDTVNITVIENPYLDLPNMFTPNGDGLNDRFRPIYAGYQQIKSFKIFNRYGQEVFNSRSSEDSWDGTFSGQPLEIGVYFWLLEAKDRSGQDVVKKGDVTLLR